MGISEVLNFFLNTSKLQLCTNILPRSTIKKKFKVVYYKKIILKIGRKVPK